MRYFNEAIVKNYSFVYQFATIIYLTALLSYPVHAQDKMQEIGTKSAAVRNHLLTIPQPVSILPNNLPLSHNPAAIFTPGNLINNKAAVDKALDSLRNTHAPFLRNLAPAQKQLQLVQTLTDFDWREEMPADKKDFASLMAGKGDWKKVTVPHYGPPLGKAVTYYRTEFEVSKEMIAKGAIYAHFKGVDYIARVFVNGNYAGSHEGIFAAFEFDVTSMVSEGKNTLVVKVENDYSMLGSKGEDGKLYHGSKLYAATGLGYDDPLEGWHHCPAGMGIYQPVTIQARSPIHLHDIFVRPLRQTDSAEVWVEVKSNLIAERFVKIRHSLFGQNFADTVYQNKIYTPVSQHISGIGDMIKSTDNKIKILSVENGVSYFRFPIVIPKARRWNNSTPWLYQIQLELLDEQDNLIDTKSKQFGMRYFTMDTVHIPKGKLLLDGNQVRLRGANTMGSFQKSVMTGNWQQLIDDILLAKLTNMNYIRFTQMPMQSEVYEYFDRLGLMCQTDLPLFGVLAKSKWAEAVKQVEEMERLVRSHPANIMVTYINERFPNADGSPHRGLAGYSEIERFFKAADEAVLLHNPDRVIKPGDGDYDPPGPSLPDNHSYNTWYNGHGLGLGEMIKGYWLPVKPGWLYGCGEFGNEGLDSYGVMGKNYPREWLPQNEEEAKNWRPDKIVSSQTPGIHSMWYNEEKTVAGWIEASQRHQAWGTKTITEAFRRDRRMVSFAIHLFIDNWPAGWMKSIVDVDRIPKKAWYEYRNALTPLAIQMRTDRFQFFSGETMPLETWVVNDLNNAPAGITIKYQLELDGKVLLANNAKASIPINSSLFQGYINATAPVVDSRKELTVRLALFAANDEKLHENNYTVIVYPKAKEDKKKAWVADNKGKAFRLATEAGFTITNTMPDADVLLIDNAATYERFRAKIDDEVANGGKTAILLPLDTGKHHIAGTDIKASKTAMGSLFFVAPEAGTPFTKNIGQSDFFLWYNKADKMIKPFVHATVSAPGWSTILKSGNNQVAAELRKGKGAFRLCQIEFESTLKHNPASALFWAQLSNH